MRLHALIGDRRIPEPSLRRHDRAVDITVADLSARLQQFGHRLQERIPVPHGQWASRIEDSGELCVGEADRPHACPVTTFRSDIRLNAIARNCDATGRSLACASYGLQVEQIR
jgi:hypothetical protein